jgi:hypothetical protein
LLKVKSSNIKYYSLILELKEWYQNWPAKKKVNLPLQEAVRTIWMSDVGAATFCTQPVSNKQIWNFFSRVSF